GLKSISEIAQKYDGEAEFTHEGMVFHASVMLVLEMPLEKEMR
ncbi:MAG: GHKL domain-containing protein, partial [Lachnospiraceae bacterium]|nr:GHKL domain-containing protein [Lachnospiraceae bacterium]